MRIGLLGLPNVGKSTLFNALTNASVLAANYPFATIEPNTGIVPVPDERLTVLAKMFKTDRIVPATVEFVDVAGLVEGASKGEGLGNKFLANIRECDAICHVVRAFEADQVQRADGKSYNSVIPSVAEESPANSGDSSLSPKLVRDQNDIVSLARSDIEIINTELMLADIATIENHLPKVMKEAKADSKARQKLEFLKSLQNALLTGQPPETRVMSQETSDLLDGLQLLTTKPVIYVFNIDENGLTDKKLQGQLSEVRCQKSIVENPLSRHPGLDPGSSKNESRSDTEFDSRLPKTDNCLFICAELESQLRELSAVEAQELLADYGVTESGLVQLARAAYQTLGLQSFLTAGPKEVRAWTIKQGATAPQAAGVIHTDFEKGFIAAQVVNYNDLIAAGSETAARAAGKIRTEGRTYVMQPDDVVEFRFNVQIVD